LIYDVKKNLSQYKGLSKNFGCAIEYLLNTDFSGMGMGKYPVDGEKVFALVQMPETRPREQTRWESHKNYIDIQYMLLQSEIIGCQNTGSLTEKTPYSAENDIVFYHDNKKGFYPVLVPDSFVICFPWDAHMPLICTDIPKKIKKVVMKVQVEK